MILESAFKYLVGRVEIANERCKTGHIAGT